jgi:hypothetical protein
VDLGQCAADSVREHFHPDLRDLIKRKTPAKKLAYTQHLELKPTKSLMDALRA